MIMILADTVGHHSCGGYHELNFLRQGAAMSTWEDIQCIVGIS